MWQKCPICNGLGTVPNYGMSSSSSSVCSVCNGQKIISELTGTPPGTLISTSDTKSNLGNINIEDEKAIVKYNNGRGAILCSDCRVIIKTFKDLTPEESKSLERDELKSQYCDKCKKICRNTK